MTFDALVLLTAIPSETSILSQYSIYNIQTFKIIAYWAFIYTKLFLKIYYSTIFFHFY